MGMLKNYLLHVITSCAPDNGFAQNAIEHAILTNEVTLTGHFETDQQAILGRYDSIVEKYHQTVWRNRRALMESYGPLVEKIRNTP